MTTATININEELNGIELLFDGKPDAEVRSTLKENGFRWSRFKGVWYTKQSEEAFKVAESVSNGNIEEAAQIAPKTATKTKTRKKKQPSFNLWNATQWEDIQVDNKKQTKEISKEVRQHLKKRFPHVKFSVRTDGKGWTDTINVDIKESPYEEGSKYLKAVMSYADELVNAYHVCHDPGDMYTDLPASYNFYFFNTSVHYTYEQTEATEAIKKDMENFDQKLEEAEKAEEERRKQEFQEWQRQREEEQKEYEKRQREEAKEVEHINNSVEVNELENDDQYFVVGSEFANLNKQCTLERYQQEVNEGDYTLKDVKVTKEIHFTNEEALNNFSNNLMHGFDFLANTGGSYTEDNRINSMTDLYNMESEDQKTIKWITLGVAVYFDNELQFVVNASGHDYARYVGLTENATIEKTVETPQKINDEELNELKQHADKLETVSADIVNELNLIDKWDNEEWETYKTAMKDRIKQDQLKISKAVIQQMEIESVKLAMYKLLQEVDGIQDQFTEADIKQGEKVTLFYISDFGSIVTSRVVMDSVENTSYAQYNNAVKLTFTPERKRKLHYSFFYSDILVYKGWHNLREEVLNHTEIKNGMKVTRSKFNSCDRKQYDCILNYFNQKGIKPVINTYKPTF